MANEAVNYHLYDGVATLRIDDGKSNVMSPSTLREIYAALDRAESDKAIQFRLDLEPGNTRIQTWFTNDRGLSLSAYHVYVRKVNA